MRVKSGRLIFSILGLFVLAGLPKPSSAAAADGPLQVAMTLASMKTIAPGQPIVLHYVITNTSMSASAHFDIGQNNTAWYHLSLCDGAGRSADSIPDLRPLTHPERGLYQTGDRVLDAGASLEGGIVVTRHFAVTRPGKYVLTVHVPLNYRAESLNEGDAPSMLHLNQSFAYPIEVTAPNPAAVRTEAKALRRKLVDLNLPPSDSWEPVAEELFSMPPSQALVSWQALASDPDTLDSVRVVAANQLAYHPSRMAANLLAQMLWDTPTTSEGGPSLTVVSRSEIAWALITMKDIASPEIKQQIQTIYSQHQGETAEVRGPTKRSEQN